MRAHIVVSSILKMTCRRRHGGGGLWTGGVTGAAGAAAAWGALFTAQTQCSRRRETGSIFVFSTSSLMIGLRILSAAEILAGGLDS